MKNIYTLIRYPKISFSQEPWKSFQYQENKELYENNIMPRSVKGTQHLKPVPSSFCALTRETPGQGHNDGSGEGVRFLAGLSLDISQSITGLSFGSGLKGAAVSPLTPDEKRYALRQGYKYVDIQGLAVNLIERIPISGTKAKKKKNGRIALP